MDINLGNFTLKEQLKHFDTVANKEFGNYYIKKIEHDNRLLLSIDQRKAYTKAHHSLEYFPEKEEVILNSKPESGAMSIYIVMLFPIGSFIINDGDLLVTLGITIGLLIIITFILSATVQSQSKDVEREFLIRTNAKIRK